MLRIWETTLTFFSYTFPVNVPPIRASETRVRLDALARFPDSAIRVPGTNVRLRADALLNPLPGIGTMTSNGMSDYLNWEARRLGVPTRTLVRMVDNVGLDFASVQSPS